jgi:hypothetical protein
MGSESPVAELYDSNGNPLAVQNGTATPANTPALMVAGSDGTNSRYFTLDTSGRVVLVGAGTAGSPVGGVLTIQGSSSGTAVPISGSITVSSGTITVDGTVTANAGSGNFTVVQATAANLNATVTANGNFNNDSVSAIAASPPASATYIGGFVTTSSPTYTTGQMNALSLTTAGALRIDGSAVTQPISGTVIANAGTGTFNISGTVTSNQGTSPWITNITQFGGSNIVTGIGSGGAGIPRVTVSNDSNILATQSGSWTVTANQGTANTLANAWAQQITDTTNGPVAVKAASTIPTVTDPALVVVLSPNQQAIPITTAPSSAIPGFATGNVTVSSTSITAVLETVYIEQSSNFTGSIISSSSNDTSTGTGARTIVIIYYDQTGAGPYTETVTLNGTTAVNLVNTNHCFIEKMIVVTVGSGGVNAGNISLYSGLGGTGTLVGSINASENITFWCHHYVPTGKSCYVTDITGGIRGSKNASFWLRSLPIPEANQAEVQITDTLRLATAAPSIVRVYRTPIKVVGPARIQAYITSDGTSTTTFFTSFTYYDQ